MGIDPVQSGGSDETLVISRSQRQGKLGTVLSRDRPGRPQRRRPVGPAAERRLVRAAINPKRRVDSPRIQVWEQGRSADVRLRCEWRWPQRRNHGPGWAWLG